MIIIGSGRVPGEQKLAQVDDPNMGFVIHAASIASLNGHNGQWMFYKSAGNNLVYLIQSMFQH